MRINALYYKEWIKTRWYLLLALLATNGFVGYTLLKMNWIVQAKGAAHIWEIMLSRDALFINLLTYIPLISGILMALVQFVPEMYHKCLKLTLHLPCSPFTVTNRMLFFGLTSLLAVYATNLLLLWIYTSQILASELYSRMLLSALPWYLAGCAAYLLFAWICLEPTWKLRTGNLVISLFVLKLFFLSDTPEAYNRFLPGLIVITLLTAPLSWLSVSRFKEGKQD